MLIRKRELTLGIFLALSVFVFSNPTHAMNQIKTDHFFIYYEPGVEGTARRVAEVAEEVFDPLASAFGYYDDFSMVHILIDDNVDYSNAYAVYYENFIRLWATALDYELRGTHDWIKNMLTHELAHIVSLKVARKKWFFNFGLLQMSRFNENPDFVIHFPIYQLIAPAWWAEGISQFEGDKIGGESWDTHRDMLLRMATLEDDLLSYDEMGIFSKDGLHAEMVYNQGYAFLLYVHEKYGDGKVEALTKNIGLLNFDSSIKKVLGIKAHKLYDEWREDITQKYNDVSRKIQKSLFEGEKTIDGGYLDYYPLYSPDGDKIAYLSNDGHDFSLTKLKILDLKTGKTHTVKDRVDNRFSWSQDGKKLAYTRRVRNFYDIFIYDVESKKEKRISVNLRAKDPAISPDGSEIAFVRNKDGTNNLGIVSIDGSKVRYLTNNNDATQYYGPKWSPDGKRIAFSIFRGEDRDIAIINADSPPFDKKLASSDTAAFPDSLAFPDASGFEAIIRTEADERDPYWLPDGSGIVFSSDRDGIFNLYEYSLQNGEVRKLSNVVGGAFCPSVAPNGEDIIYAGYHAADYSIYKLKRTPSEKVELVQLDRDYQSIFTGKKLEEEYKVGPYSRKLSISGIYPIISLGPKFIGWKFGLNQLSAGLQVVLGDILRSNRFVGWASVGKSLREETDLNSDFLLYYEKSLSPVLSESKTFRPRLYAGYRKRTVNNFFDRTVDSIADTSRGTVVVPTDTARILIPNAIQYRDQRLIQEDDYKNGFEIFATGVELRLNPRQMLTLEYARRKYSENLAVKRIIKDRSRIFQEVGEDTVEITERLKKLSPTEDQVIFEDFFYEDLDFFKSDNLTVLWRYSKLKPTVDMYINPSGRFVTLGYRRLNSTVADSLVSLTSTDGTPVDIFGPDNRKLGMNEYIFSWAEFIGLPFRNTLSFWFLTQYRDKMIKKYVEGSRTGEGVFYWPLRYYMGGQGFLSGYPYFTLSGSKRIYGWMAYTFPIFQNIQSQLLNFHFDKLYATVFAEAGGTWNFEKFKTEHFDWDDFLTDAGFELRLQMFSFYRVPLMGYFQVAWPVGRGRHLKVDDKEIDKQRYYFGISLF